MADTDVSLALSKIREQLAALNFASDAVSALVDDGKIGEIAAGIRLRRLSARRTDLRDERMTIIMTQTVADPPSPEEIEGLRARVTELYQFNVTAAAIDELIGIALDIAG